MGKEALIDAMAHDSTAPEARSPVPQIVLQGLLASAYAAAVAVVLLLSVSALGGLAGFIRR